jgi:hypothetical protein
VDLRYDQEVVLEMAGGGGSQTTTDDGKPTGEKPRMAGDGTPAKPSAGVKADSAKAAAHKAPVKPKTPDKKHAPAAQKRVTGFETRGAGRATTDPSLRSG